MRPLKPSTILLLGGSLTGTVMSVAFLAATSGARNGRGFCIAFAVGAGFGLLMFCPIALAEKFRKQILAGLQRYGPRVQPRIGFVMTLALGYWIASMRHGMFDAVSFIAMGLVLVGALFGVMIGIATDDGRRKAA